MEDESIHDNAERRSFETGHDPAGSGRSLFFDISLFSSLLKLCFDAIGAKQKRLAIKKLLHSFQWALLYRDKHSGCCVYAERGELEHKHELSTAKALSQKGYDVLFAPKAMFSRTEKKFDVFLIRDHIILRADLKSISSTSKGPIANRIINGAAQASRIVVDIVSDIRKRELIDGLKSGVQKSESLVEILLFYNSRFYRLNRNEILSKKIYELIK